MSNTNYDRIKNMSLDEMASFLAKLTHDDIITVADRYICKKCKSEHNGKCPMADDECLYDYDNVKTVKTWLMGEQEDG